MEHTLNDLETNITTLKDRLSQTIFLTGILLTLFLVSIFLVVRAVIAPEAIGKYWLLGMLLPFAAGFYWLNRKGFVRQSYWLLSLVSYLVTLHYSYQDGGLYSPTYQGTAVLIFLYGLLIGQRGILIVSVMDFLSGIVFLSLQIGQANDPLMSDARLWSYWVSHLMYLVTALTALYMANYLITKSMQMVRQASWRINSAETALRESEARFRRMADNIQDGLAIVENGKIVYSNRRTEEILGVRTEELPKLNGLEIAAEDERPRIRAMIEEARRTGSLTPQLSFWIHRPDGTRRFVRNRYAVIRRNHELVDRYIFSTDLTEEKLAQEETERQLRNLAALHTIDQAIAGTTDLDEVMQVLIDQIVECLGADAADILLFDPEKQELSYRAGKGFHLDSLTHIVLRIGQGLASEVIQTGAAVLLEDLERSLGDRMPKSWQVDGLRAYFGMPLIAKNQINGVLEVYMRKPFQPEPGWLNFLSTLAGQAAIAIDNARLFERLEESNLGLISAYDLTLEGWAKALELRDRETEGHSRRVVHWTLKLARSLGMNEADLPNIRRGALLHDIGKMGIPDNILHKPGPLSDSEWEVMRRHPVYAYELLAPIPFLKSALDIPHYHHERWDGLGYPRGLEKTSIPLAARIFSVIDAWDALLSDRPYRPAWNRSEVLAYLKREAGRQFDPQVVAAFIQLLAADEIREQSEPEQIMIEAPAAVEERAHGD